MIDHLVLQFKDLNQFFAKNVKMENTCSNYKIIHGTSKRIRCYTFFNHTCNRPHARRHAAEENNNNNNNDNNKKIIIIPKKIIIIFLVIPYKYFF